MLPKSIRRSLLASATALLAAGCATNRADPALAPIGPVGADELLADITWLSADARGGRATGEPGLDSAAAFVARRYASLGIAPIAGEGIDGYMQLFTAHAIMTRHEPAAALPTQNVVAMIPGTDPALADQYVVLGAHLDHLGRSPSNALDSGTAIRNGADDNASGTVAVLELARRLKADPPRRSVILTHFSGEEYGLLGSQYFVEHSPVPLTSMQAMINFDMVGRLKDDRLIVYGVGTAAELPALLDSVNAGSGIIISKVPDGIGPSDHASFHTKDVPVLHFFTDIHDDYHRATDDAFRINAEGMLRVVDVAEKVTRALADRPGKLAVTRTVATTRTGSRQSSGVYLGSVPDMGAADVPGMKLSGVRAGSPADKGGLRGGDIVIEFGGKSVKDIYEYTDALNSFKPGDEVKVIVMRDGQRLTLTVTLGSRDG